MLTQAYKDWSKADDPEVLAQFAIQAALESDWQEAGKINLKILKTSVDNIEALNRLARAQCCTNQIDKAKKTYEKALSIDPYNIIARKNLDKISKLPNTGTKTNGHTNGNGHSAYANGNGNTLANLSTVFLYEPGKTKVINLLNLASPSVLAGLNCGEKVLLHTKKHSIGITSQDGVYLGALPDDLSHRLIAYVSGGNKYEAYVKFATTKSLSIFIREVERSEKFTNQPSFQDNRQFIEEKEVAYA